MAGEARGGRGVRDAGHVTFRDVFAVSEYRAVWSAQVLSLIGDQLALIALTVVVFGRTGSPLLTAATWAISFLPWLIGGPLLSGLADRMPRRRVMVACDLGRAALVAAMVVPGLPLWLLCGLLFVTELLASPFCAARAAVLPDVLPGDRYVLGTAIGNITNQGGQVAGFAVGGALVALLGAPTVLALDAGTFVASALLLQRGLRQRPAARGGGQSGTSLLATAAAGVRLVFGDRDLRVLAGLGWLCAFYVVPEGLAVPYAAALGGGPAAAGLLLAAAPCGAMAGALVFSRFVRPATRLRSMGPLAVAASAPLVGCLLHPGLVVSAVLFAGSGAASAYQLAANAAFVAAVPAGARGQAFGLVQAGMSVGQGLAIVLAGAAAQAWEPTWVIAVAGGAGCLAAAALSAAWQRTPGYALAGAAGR